MNKKFLSAILFGALMVLRQEHLYLVKTMMMTSMLSTRS
ncbi:hypothetical protein VIC01_04306 [Phocaeicola vulgatus]|uniref:Uncharacterized protein n=1 Tax=Phocaeicola vulgatus TaxID=821 RepID=A0A5P3AY36_PHOVU|nr:hypothetical protein VIC01_04306 [Phocaeicola vulgatus]